MQVFVAHWVVRSDSESSESEMQKQIHPGSHGDMIIRSKVRMFSDNV